MFFNLDDVSCDKLFHKFVNFAFAVVYGFILFTCKNNIFY